MQSKAWLLSLGSLVLVCQAAFAEGDVARGQKVFKKADCVECHAKGGNEVNPRKPIKGAEFAEEFKDDKVLEAKIRTGVTGTPMRGFSEKKISQADMCDLIAYIRSLTPKTETPKTENAGK